MARTPRRRRASRSVLLRRWLAVGTLLLVALLYYRPLRSWVEKSGSLQVRQAEVARLSSEKRLLQERLAYSTSEAALARSARRLGYVLPGEHLYIVKGIETWRTRRTASLPGHAR
jgi:hypothetical protein